MMINFEMAWKHYIVNVGADDAYRVPFHFTDLKIQKTLPTEGYHVWHIEHGKGYDNEARAFVFSVYLNDVEEGESADLAGLLPGDVIVEFDNKQIKFSSDLPHVVGQIKPDTLAYAKVIRDGQEIILDFVLGELPVNNETFIPAKTQTSSDPIGFIVADIDRGNPSMANMPDGVIVSRVNTNSPASGKVNRGDIVTMIQFKGKKYQITDVVSFNTTMENFSSGDKVAVHLLRGGNRFIRSITLN